jgi:hypothetical protein
VIDVRDGLKRRNEEEQGGRGRQTEGLGERAKVDGRKRTHRTHASECLLIVPAILPSA